MVLINNCNRFNDGITLETKFKKNFTNKFLGSKSRRNSHNQFDTSKKFEKAIIDARGDRTKVAEMLNISRATFFRRAIGLGLVNGRRV